METSRKGKVMVLVSATIFLFLSICFVILCVQSRNENDLFLKHGKRTKATILALETVEAKRNKSYLMRLGMFVDANSECGTGQTGSSNAMRGAKQGSNMDGFLDSSKASKEPGEKYHTISVRISNVTYSKYNVGGKVEVVYLPENPTNVKLLEEIDGI